MIDFDKLPNDTTIRAFVTPCEYRHERGGQKVCEKISENIGSAHGVDAILCSKCRLLGPVDDGIIMQVSKTNAEGNFNRVALGHHRSADQVKSVIDYAMRLSANDTAMRTRVENTIVLCVAVARITKDEAHAVFTYYGYPETHPVRGLIDENHIQLKARVDKGMIPNNAPCGAPCEGKPVGAEAGVLDHVLAIGRAGLNVFSAAISKQTSAEGLEYRKKTCYGCPIYRSPRIVDGRNFPATCGDPWTVGSAARDQKKDGCGCSLEEKWAAENQVCPKGLWGAE